MSQEPPDEPQVLTPESQALLKNMHLPGLAWRRMLHGVERAAAERAVAPLNSLLEAAYWMHRMLDLGGPDGSEHDAAVAEDFMEGMKAWGAKHWPADPVTRVGRQLVHEADADNWKDYSGSPVALRLKRFVLRIEAEMDDRIVDRPE